MPTRHITARARKNHEAGLCQPRSTLSRQVVPTPQCGSSAALASLLLALLPSSAPLLLPWRKKIESKLPGTLLPCRNASCYEFSLCLSRACLGKMIIFMYKAQKDSRFLTMLNALKIPE